MNKNKQVSVIAAVALALGASASFKFPSFREATAIAAIAVDHSNSNDQATSIGEGTVNPQTKLAALSKVQPNDDGYKPEPARAAQCGQQQASGGQKGDRRVVKFPPGKGKKTVKIFYDMVSITDRLQVIYKGKQILDTGFVSGDKTRSISFNQSPKEITVILTGNPKQSGTAWTYTVFCPK